MKMLSDFVAATNGKLHGENKPCLNWCTDTRKIQPGDFFVALKGDKFDGHQFIAQAAQLGAVAAIVDHPADDQSITQLVVVDTTAALGNIASVYRAQFKGTVIGVTGSGGKTTVKGMLHSILSVTGVALSTAGNFNNHIGVPLTLLRMDKQNFAVVEMGTNHPGEIEYLTSLVKPDIALVNNVMPAHIGGFGSLAAIAKEKGSIYSKLTTNQIAVINLDDQFAEQFLAQTSHVQRWTFAVLNENAKDANVLASDLQRDEWGRFSFTLRHQQHTVRIRLSVLGAHMVTNALAAATCALAAGSSLPTIAEGLSQYTGEKGRMQLMMGRQQSHVIDDTYNANPGSVNAAIDYLALCAGKKILVLGDLGELGEMALDAHKQIGEYAKKMGIDALYTVGEKAALAAVCFGESGFSFKNKHDLVEQLIGRLDSQTTVLVKGSRSAKMEDVCGPLVEVGEKSPC